MMRCAWCQEEDIRLIPVVNRNPTIDAEHEFVCGACSEVERFEHGDELLWWRLSPIRWCGDYFSACCKLVCSLSGLT